ncbi:acyl-CoA dehydrogenase family protein [Sphingobium sp. Sx8-8]|uniref:acyl-CoA dehydrogenase family protein n=1 Tax=Sphingobium sp. Sx8-8 TaxID=2933617 RepID=UPI001F56B8CD|nr:acyl-CoA dehydrogenase family protein [Sphingobium sp. Sx8-8]
MSRAPVPAADIGPIEAQLAMLPGLDRLRSIVPSFAEASGDTVAAILGEAAAFAAEQLEGVNQAGEHMPPRLLDGCVRLAPVHRGVWQSYASAGWMTLDLPVAHGGQGLPLVVAIAAQEIFDRHCAAFGMLPVPSRSAARLIDAFAPDDLKAQWLPRLMFGEWGATICISEVGAGSDAGRMRTLAVPRDDGTWSVTGEKQWISFGSHDLTERIGHCLLARTEGAKGLSLFLVPSEIGGASNGVFVRGLERKLGLHSSPTCAMGFEGATGFLLGEEGRGLQQMFVMIANMRMAVGAMGLGMAGAAADIALAYARDRRQGGNGPEPVPIIDHADVQRMVLDMQSDVEMARALIYAAAVETDLGRHEGDAERGRESAALAQWLLPIVKTLGGELAFDTASTAMQLLGGAGYTADWPVEQLLRDARVLPIFEGTTGMQAIDLLHRRLWKEGGEGLRIFVGHFDEAIGRLEEMGERHEAGEAKVILALLIRTADRLKLMTARPREAEAGATAFLALATDAALGWSAARLLAVPGDGPVERRLRALAGYGLARLGARARLHAEQALAGAARLEAVATLA